jgi:hypothetical protein
MAFDESHPEFAKFFAEPDSTIKERSEHDLLNTRTEMNLNLHSRQRVYRFEQESSSFNATVVLTQDHCISLDSTKNA